MPFARTRPAPKSARKRAGTVSRFFASSEYSAVPSKAIAGAHGKKSDRGGGVGGAPPPRSVVGHSNPTTSHKASLIAQKIPPAPLLAPTGPRKPSVHRGFRPIDGMSDECPVPAIGHASARSATRPAGSVAF